MLSRWLGIPAERVICKSGDPNGPALVGAPSIGSRSGFSQGSAYKVASEVIIEKAKPLAADMLEAHAEDIVFADGTFTIAGTDRSVTMTAVLEKHAGEKPHPLDTIAERPISVTFPSGAHIAEVEIDPQSGDIDILRYTAVDDIGTVLNATLADGQLIGGVVQGASHVFGEDCRYDPADGQLITGSFMDYRIARADLLPHIETLHRCVPTPTNPLGAKGVGEAGSAGAMVACFNAVMDALRSAGVQSFDIPATPPRIWAALAVARQSEGGA
jgi:carbon-monoxide dehydrogenase large subunit